MRHMKKPFMEKEPYIHIYIYILVGRKTKVLTEFSVVVKGIEVMGEIERK